MTKLICCAKRHFISQHRQCNYKRHAPSHSRTGTVIQSGHWWRWCRSCRPRQVIRAASGPETYSASHLNKSQITEAALSIPAQTLSHSTSLCLLWSPGGVICRPCSGVHFVRHREGRPPPPPLASSAIHPSRGVVVLVLVVLLLIILCCGRLSVSRVLRGEKTSQFHVINHFPISRPPRRRPLLLHYALKFRHLQSERRATPSGGAGVLCAPVGGGGGGCCCRKPCTSLPQTKFKRE